MAYECPLFLYPVNERMVDSLIYEDISSITVNNSENCTQ